MKLFNISILFMMIYVSAASQIISKYNLHNITTETYSISNTYYQYNDARSYQVPYSLIEIENKNDSMGFVFFDENIGDKNYNVYDFLYDRFFLKNNMSLYQAIMDGNVRAQIDLYSTFIKRMPPKTKFSIVTNCDSVVAKKLARQIRFVSISDMSKFKSLRNLESCDSYFFSVPDTFFLDKVLIADTSPTTDTFENYSNEKINQVKQFLCDYYSYITSDPNQGHNAIEHIEYTDLKNYFSSNVKALCHSLNLNYDPIFKGHMPTDDFCDNVKISVDSADYCKNYTTVKLHITYIEKDTNTTIGRSIRILKNTPGVMITHIYDILSQ